MKRDLTRRGFVGTVLAAIGVAKCLPTRPPLTFHPGYFELTVPEVDFCGYSEPWSDAEDLEGAITMRSGARPACR